MLDKPWGCWTIVSALQSYSHRVGRVKDESSLSTNSRNIEVRQNSTLKTWVINNGKKCVWFNFTFSFKYQSYSILVTFTFSCHVCSQNYSGSTNESRLRLLWLLLTSTEFSLQKWFFFFLCHTQHPPLEVRPSCNRRYSVILSRGWYSYSYKVSSYCQQTQINNQPTVHQLLSHSGRRSGCSSLSWFPQHEHKVTHEQMLIHICPESAGKTPDLLIWKDFQKQVSTVSWFWQSWFCQSWSDKRRKIWVSRESKKLLERRIFSLSLIFVIRDEVGQPDRIRRNRDLSACSSGIQSATWLQSHTQL